MATDVTYPVIEVGDLVTASLLTSMLPKFSRKTANESAPASTITVQDDDELFVSVEANASYFVEGWLRYTAASNTPDIRINYSYPSGATFARTDWGATNGSTTTADTVEMSIATTGDVGRGAGTTQRSIYLKGDLVVGSTAGTFKVQFGQVTSSVDLVTMNLGSRIILTRYA